MMTEAGIVELQYYGAVKVHHSMCLKLKNFIDGISKIFIDIESARPRCTSGIQALCSLLKSIERAKLLILHCSDSSKLYLAITGDKIKLRCEKIRDSLLVCLSQIQNMVPSLLARQIARLVDELSVVTFMVESSEDEAGKVLVSLLKRDKAASDSLNMFELEAFQMAAVRLCITSPVQVLIEKRSIRRLLEKIQDTELIKRKILNYLLHLIRKYGKLIGGYQTENIIMPHEKGTKLENSKERAQALDTPEPPKEFKCPISARLMCDPVITANGQTFERVCIEKWFDEGHKTCPKTHTKLSDLSLITNYAIKDAILSWCTKQGITVLEPCFRPTSAGHHLQNLSSSASIASIGSSLNGLHLEISNVSLRSSDSDSVHDLLDHNMDGGLNVELPSMNLDIANSESTTNSHGINLAFLSELDTFPWALKRKAVEDLNVQLKNGQRRLSGIPSSHIGHVVRFLKDAHGLQDSKAEKDGACLLLEFLRETRSEMPPLQEDAIYVLSSMLASEITEEALAIMDVFSSQQYSNSMIVASGILLSVLGALEEPRHECKLLAMKIICNLSANIDIGHHMVYLDYIPKVALSLGDQAVAGYSIKILRNLCSIGEARVAIAGSNECRACIAELLDAGTDEEQELAMDVLRALCYDSAECCQLVMNEGVILSLMYLYMNGNDNVKLTAMDLLQLSWSCGHDHAL